MTGATWARKIESAKITVDWSRMKQRERPVMRFTRVQGEDFVRSWKPLGAKSETIEFKNVKPDFNLEVTSWPKKGSLLQRQDLDLAELDGVAF